MDKMKHALTLTLLLLVFGCSKKPVDLSKTVEREGIRYLVDKYGNSNKPLNGEAVAYFMNGQLIGKGTFRDGKPDGAFERYYMDGKLASKGAYKDGKRHGAYESYDEDGKLETKLNYKDGELVE